MDTNKHESNKDGSGVDHVRHYFVDEAGDLTLFDKKGRPLLGKPGVSSIFMVGLVDLPDPEAGHHKLEALRQALLADAYFSGVPSMREESGKTARFFHAKDDVPEVRREVFRLLPQLGCKVQIIIRSKDALTEDAQALFKYRGEKLRANDIYDDLVSRLFRNVLHKADENRVVFARRGSNDRREALEAAIRKAKIRFSNKHGMNHDRPTIITAGHPWNYAGLQVVDYYLWAVQRLYERGEERFFRAVEKDYRLIMDIDNKVNKPYGEWFCDQNPLTLDKIKRPPKS
jgi:hypothetical protein